MIKHLLFIAAGCRWFHAASAQKYVDASTLTIIGRTCPMEGHPYYRVDTTRYRFDNATIRHYCGYPAGVAVLFTTDSRRIEARWTTAPRNYGWNMTPVLQRGMDLYVRENGVWTMGRCGTSRITGPARQHHRRAHGRTAQGVHALPAGVERTADAGDRRGRRSIRYAARIALQAPRDRLRIERHPRSFGQPPGHDLSCAHEPHDGHRVRQSGVQRQLHAPTRIRAAARRDRRRRLCSTPFRTPPRR